MPLLHIVVIIALSFVLGRSAASLARSVRKIGRSLRVDEFLLSFLLLGLATSMPEISVAFFSAVRGVPGLSLGNLLGADIVILSLLAGLATLIAGKLKVGSFYKDNMLALFVLVIALPALAALDGRIDRIEGMGLIIAHAGFVSWFASRGQRFKPLQPEPLALHRVDLKHEGYHAVVAASVLLVASFFIVRSALAVATGVGLPPLIVGLLMLSLGTNLPEFTFVVTQARGKNSEVVLGDLFGSLLMNTPTLGLLALIRPFEIAAHGQALVAAAFLFALLALFALFAWTKQQISRWEGAMLLSFYVVYLLQMAGILKLGNG